MTKRTRSSPTLPRNRVLRVALTGGIACGKSVVARILHEKGCYLYSADAAAHALMGPGKPAWRKIVARFGEGILDADRTIDRKALGRIVFSDGEARAFMNALIHPLVLADQARRVRRLEREGRTKIFVSEAALTVEAGAARRFDKVVVVHCPPEVQVRRLMARDGLGERAARQRMRSQMPQKEKLRHADYAVDASGSLEETVDETERLFAALVRDYEGLGTRRGRKG